MTVSSVAAVPPTLDSLGLFISFSFSTAVTSRLDLPTASTISRMFFLCWLRRSIIFLFVSSPILTCFHKE
jgi:hypothetical protein